MLAASTEHSRYKKQKLLPLLVHLAQQMNPLLKRKQMMSCPFKKLKKNVQTKEPIQNSKNQLILKQIVQLLLIKKLK